MLTEAVGAKRQALIACNREAQVPLVLDPDVLSEKIKAEPSKNRYRVLGAYAETVLLDRHALSTDRIKGASEAGFDILTKLLAISPHAYARFCRQQARPLSRTELSESLHRSDETPGRIMDLPGLTANTVEVTLGLTYPIEDADQVAATGRYFRFEPAAEGPLFTFDENEFVQASSNPRYHAGIPERWQRCLARRLVTEQIWPAMIDVATETPEIFARDLEMLDTIGHA